MKALEIIAFLTIVLYAVIFLRQERKYFNRTYLIPYSVDTLRTILHNYCDEKSNLYLDLRGDKLICSGDHLEDVCFILHLYENGTGTRAELSNESLSGGGNRFRSKHIYFKMVEKVFKNLGAEDITGA